jgi:hypothetical protein
VARNTFLRAKLRWDCPELGAERHEGAAGSEHGARAAPVPLTSSSGRAGGDQGAPKP